MFIISVSYLGELYREMFNSVYCNEIVRSEISEHYTRNIFVDEEIKIDWDGIIKCVRDCDRKDALLDAVRLASSFGATSDQITELVNEGSVIIGYRSIDLYEVDNLYYHVKCIVDIFFKETVNALVSKSETGTSYYCDTNNFSIIFEGLFRKIDISGRIIDFVNGSFIKDGKSITCDQSLIKLIEESIEESNPNTEKEHRIDAHTNDDDKYINSITINIMSLSHEGCNDD